MKMGCTLVLPLDPVPLSSLQKLCKNEVCFHMVFGAAEGVQEHSPKLFQEKRPPAT